MNTHASHPDAIALLGMVARADAVAREHFDRGVLVRRKSDGSPVTAADLACNESLLAGLREFFPADAVCSEESPATPGSSAHRWVVDPIDGTSAFIEGLAHWGPSLARLDASGRVVLGATSLPRLRETWLLHDGVAWFGGRRLGALTAEDSAPRVVYVPSGMHRGMLLRWSAKARCLGGTAAHLALVARGSARAVIVGPDWQLWDVACGLGLIDAVGGVARRLPDGASLRMLDDVGTPFIAGEPEAVARLFRPGTLDFLPLSGAPDVQPRS